MRTRKCAARDVNTWWTLRVRKLAITNPEKPMYPSGFTQGPSDRVLHPHLQPRGEQIVSNPPRPCRQQQELIKQVPHSFLRSPGSDCDSGLSDRSIRVQRPRLL